MTQADLIALLERCLKFVEAWEKECGNTELGNDLRAALDEIEHGVEG